MESHKFDRHTQTKRRLGALLRVSCSGRRVACDLVTSYFLVVTSLMRSCRTHIGVAYQSRHRADLQGGQRNLLEGLFVLLEIKRSATMMGSAISSLITSVKLLNSSFFLLTFLMYAVGQFRLTNSLCVDSKLFSESVCPVRSVISFVAR